MPRKRDVKDVEKEIKDIRRGIHLPAGKTRNADKNKEPVISLKTFTTSIALAALKAKTAVDTEAVKVKKEIYEKDAIMKNLPISTFDLSEIEVELKFVVEDVKGDDIMINTNLEKIASLQNSLSTVRLKFTSKPIVEYTLADGGKVIK